MSMSQAEIEALMNGAESIQPDEEIEEETNSEEAISEEVEEDSTVKAEDTQEEISISEVEEEPAETETNEDLDDILAGIDGIVDDDVEDTNTPKEKEVDSSDESLEKLIDESQYPLPVKSENKVVNQLNEVADDSEEKASQIFDVLSFILDENNEIQGFNKNMGEFIESQVVLLEALSKKFPNIDVFSENLTKAESLVEDSKQLSLKVDGENNKVFEAMELMQYHDINRQKIERVMAVIRKLNSYLNGIFEDENDRPEVQIAKHISGDSNDIVDADDIDSMIAEFSNEG